MTEQRRSTLPLLPGIVDQPGKTLAQVAIYPRGRWLVPLLFLVATMTILAVMSAPYMAQETASEFQKQIASLPTEQARVIEQAMQFISAPAFLIGTNLVVGLLGLLVSWIVASAILFFASLIFGGDLAYGHAFAIAPWLWIPYGLRDVTQSLTIWLEAKTIANPGLSFLVATGDRVKDMGNLGYLLTAQIDLFTLWHYLLVYAGLRAVGQLSGVSAVFVTLIYAVLMLGLGVLPGLFGGALFPAG